MALPEIRRGSLVVPLPDFPVPDLCAAFILQSLGRRSAPRRSCAALRQVAIGQSWDQSPGKQLRDRFVAYDMSSLWWPHVAPRVVRSTEANYVGAPTAVPVVCRSGAGRRQADGSRSDVVMSGVVDSGRESGHGSIDANDPNLRHGDSGQFRSGLRTCRRLRAILASWRPCGRLFG